MTITSERFSDLKRMRCCGVWSMALVLNRDFDSMFEMLRFGRSDKWRGSTTNSQRQYILDMLKVDYIEIPLKKSYRKTLRSQLIFLDATKVYLIHITGHVLTFKDGLLFDQSNPNGKAIGDYIGKNKLVKNILQVGA